MDKIDPLKYGTDTELEVLNDFNIHFKFSDGTDKTINFKPFIQKDPLSSRLGDKAYFKQVKIYKNGRGIFSPNEFDFCPDFLYHYHPKE